jgi:hypothetical protein
MDPFTGGSFLLSLFGAGSSIFGGLFGSSASKAIAEAEMRKEALLRQQMELQNKRQVIEATRQGQIQSALAISRAVNQGAEGAGGSSLPGGLAQIAGETNRNLTGLSQALQIGEGIFNENAFISQQKMNQAAAQSWMYFGQGLSNLGDQWTKSIPAMRRITGNWQGGTSGGWSYMSNPWQYTGGIY